MRSRSFGFKPDFLAWARHPRTTLAMARARVRGPVRAAARVRRRIPGLMAVTNDLTLPVEAKARRNVLYRLIDGLAHLSISS